MATDASTVAYLLDQLGAGYSTKRMFGEYCLYRDGKPVALVCDGDLFVKDTEAGRAALDDVPALAPPYPGARDHLRITADAWDDADRLRTLLERTADALPPPKPRKPSKRTR